MTCGSCNLTILSPIKNVYDIKRYSENKNKGNYEVY